MSGSRHSCASGARGTDSSQVKCFSLSPREFHPYTTSSRRKRLTSAKEIILRFWITTLWHKTAHSVKWTGYRSDDRRSIPERDRDVSLRHRSCPMGTVVRWTEREAGHSELSSCEVKKAWSFTSNCPDVFKPWGFRTGTLTWQCKLLNNIYYSEASVLQFRRHWDVLLLSPPPPLF
jgi:hypothetical protein